MNRDFIEKWQKELPSKREKLRSFLLNLKQMPPEPINRMAKVKHDQVFGVVDCLQCANCCTTTPAVLNISDIKRISKFLCITPKYFRYKYVIEDLNGELSFRKVPCVFLEEDNKCKVYEVRPEACRGYPHTGIDDFVYRTKLHRANLEVCPAVLLILERMEKDL